MFKPSADLAAPDTGALADAQRGTSAVRVNSMSGQQVHLSNALLGPNGAGASAPATLRRLLESGDLLLAPGASDALTARLIERVGYRICYFTGAGFANSQFGLPDVGLVTLGEVVEQLRRIVAATNIPIIADADTGYGNALNVMRTVREFEAAGVAAIQIEDQVSPKRCGHFAGKAVVPISEMVKKIEAALLARADPELVIVARTDARRVEGLPAAIARARAYADVGADVIFIEAPESMAELEEIPRAIPDRPHLANIVVGGLTPPLATDRLAALGYRIVIFPNVALQAAARAIQDTLTVLKNSGDVSDITDRLISWEERQAIVGLGEIQLLEQRYLEFPNPI